MTIQAETQTELHKIRVERRYRYLVTVRTSSREDADLEAIADPIILGGGEDEI